MLRTFTVLPLTAVEGLVVVSVVVDTVNALSVALQIRLGGEAAVMGAAGFFASVWLVYCRCW